MEMLDPFFEKPWIHNTLGLVYNNPELWPKVKQRLSKEMFEEPEIKEMWDIFDNLWLKKAFSQDAAMNAMQKMNSKGAPYAILSGNVCNGPVALNVDYYIDETRNHAFNLMEAKLKDQKKHAVLRDDEALEREIALRLANLRSERDEGPSNGQHGQKLSDVFKSVQEALEDDSKENFISTGYRKLDGAITGWSPGNLIIMAARPGMGKTACALNFANRVLDSGRNVVFFSMEMGGDEIDRRMVAIRSGIENRKLKLGQRGLSSFEIDKFWAASEAAEKRQGEGKWFRFCGSKSISDITGHVDLVHSEMPGSVSLVIIDYLTLIKTDGQAQNREREVAQLSTALKHYAMESQLPILCLAQPSRAIDKREGNIPINSDLRDSGQIEQDADIIMWVHREKDKKENIFAETEFIITKNRNGEIGGYPGFYFDAPTQTLRET